MTRRNYRSQDAEGRCDCHSCCNARAPVASQRSLYSGAVITAPIMSYDFWTTTSGTGNYYYDPRTRDYERARAEHTSTSYYDPEPRTPLALIVYADASLDGFGFWSPQLNKGFYGDLPRMPLLDDINFMEYYAVANAISWACKRLEPGDRIRVYTDSMNTVDKFNGGSAEEEYGEIIDAVDELVKEAAVRLSVWHIPGYKNKIADCLSRPDLDLEYILDLKPNIQINYYNVSRHLERRASYI